MPHCGLGAAQKLNAAALYTAKLEFCGDDERVALLTHRAECWLADGVDEYEKAHADCNEALSLDPEHERCLLLRQRAEAGIWKQLTLVGIFAARTVVCSYEASGALKAGHVIRRGRVFAW